MDPGLILPSSAGVIAAEVRELEAAVEDKVCDALL